MNKILIAIVFLFFCAYALGQSPQLSENNFTELLIGKVWSVENQEHKEGFEQMGLALTSDTVIISYMNWIEGLWRINCQYSKLIEKDMFQLKIGDCEEKYDIKFIYGYMHEYDLYILMSTEAFKLTPELKNSGTWLKFEAI